MERNYIDDNILDGPMRQKLTDLSNDINAVLRSHFGGAIPAYTLAIFHLNRDGSSSWITSVKDPRENVSLLKQTANMIGQDLLNKMGDGLN